MTGEVWLDYTVTYLEMTTRPEGPRRPMPALPGFMVLRAEAPPARWFLHLYDSVGEGHEWTDWHRRPVAELEAFIADPEVAIFTVMIQGWTAGFFMLDWRKAGQCDLAYFGLAPEAQGRGIGAYLLDTAIRTGWAEKGVTRMTVETCTLDDPRALPMYQRAGFSPIGREDKRRLASASD
ncbi:MAG: GNAT family N-acetyltransferase [Pseudomonadota bacterium]